MRNRNLEKEYINFLEEKISMAKEDYAMEKKETREWADENLEYSRGADYDLMIEDAWKQLCEVLQMLLDEAQERGVNAGDLERLFGGYGLDF